MMKQDISKIKQWIKDTKDYTKNVKTGRPSPAIYRTFLYCLRSQYRNRLHMQVWNKDHQDTLKLFDPASTNRYVMDPLSGKMEFKSLDDQQAFIVHMIQHIIARRASAEDYLARGCQWPWLQDWAGLETNFDKIEEVGTEVAVVQ